MTLVQPKHKTLESLADTGFVTLRGFPGQIDPREWEELTYLDWQSGGDTNFAVLASANGEDDPRGFWEHGKPDKDGVGRVRVIKLQPSTDLAEVTGRYLHRDDNNRLNPEGAGWVVRSWLNLTDNPDSYMVLREERDDPSTERHIPLPTGAQFVVDTERLWHAVYHVGDAPRYALITSFESGPGLQAWMDANAVTS
jgi:hypothetical protein